jgi:hypothetical protein
MLQAPEHLKAESSYGYAKIKTILAERGVHAAEWPAETLQVTRQHMHSMLSHVRQLSNNFGMLHSELHVNRLP